MTCQLDEGALAPVLQVMMGCIQSSLPFCFSPVYLQFVHCWRGENLAPTTLQIPSSFKHKANFDEVKEHIVSHVF